MQCRNCKHHLNDDSRYCPHCGRPSSVAWPVAGAPWLRRPTAIIALGGLVVAWLFALQKALWLPHHPSTGRPTAQRIARLPKPASAIQERPTVAAPRRQRSVSGKSGSAPHPVLQRPRPAPSAVHRAPAAEVRIAESQPPRSRPAAVVARPALPRRAQLAATPSHASGAAARPLPSLTRLASSENLGPTVRPARARVGGWRQSQDAAPNLSASRPLKSGSWKLVSARFRPMPPPPGIRPSDLVVRVTAKPAGFRTFVYYNGGSVLGTAPLSVRFDRPGRYRLTFWTPDIRGRAARWVTVSGRRPQRLAVVTGSPSQIARLR